MVLKDQRGLVMGVIAQSKLGLGGGVRDGEKREWEEGGPRQGRKHLATEFKWSDPGTFSYT